MEQIKLIAISVMVALVLAISWQVGAAYVENYGFGSDLNYLTAQNNARTGLKDVSTEDELKSAVIASAQEHGISLASDHLTVHRTLTPGKFSVNGTLEKDSVLGVSIAADYDAPIKLLPGLSFNIHFAPASSYSAPVRLR